MVGGAAGGVLSTFSGVISQGVIGGAIVNPQAAGSAVMSIGSAASGVLSGAAQTASGAANYFGNLYQGFSWDGLIKGMKGLFAGDMRDYLIDFIQGGMYFAMLDQARDSLAMTLFSPCIERPAPKLRLQECEGDKARSWQCFGAKRRAEFGIGGHMTGDAAAAASDAVKGVLQPGADAMKNAAAGISKGFGNMSTAISESSKAASEAAAQAAAAARKQMEDGVKKMLTIQQDAVKMLKDLGTSVKEAISSAMAGVAETVRSIQNEVMALPERIYKWIQEFKQSIQDSFSFR
eukprot:gnl/MRDRNA2_/MRDRNA2_79250_c0_seq3.p1 gnl/MRDRNA2_/MRDRNA2_79250_c0~~gnl/MRDRNA2_/MRDRNA2_79250_c0_seq3.p1  ORF type:complete len:291 (+),score=74.88 gnl/MRDRNA2_/MRDRNA2_79250_c0_seq3:185-1057(+)